MTRLACLALVTTFATSASIADAGGCRGRVVYPKPVPTIQPIDWVRPAPAPVRNWYFGVSLQLINTQWGRGLQVASVTPGAPASLAGLEVGDILLGSSVMRFNHAYSNHHGVDLLQQSVLGGGAPAPAVTTVSTRIVPQSGYADLQVIDVRTGGVTNLRVFPQWTGGGIGGPVPTYTNPAPAFSTSPAPAFGATAR